MRIYLDNCVIQDLKRQENIDLLNAIIVDKKYNVYCYSEAPLQGLMRDKSNHKFDDLEFMEKWLMKTAGIIIRRYFLTILNQKTFTILFLNIQNIYLIPMRYFPAI